MVQSKIGYDEIKKLAFFAVALGCSTVAAGAATTTIGKAAAFLTTLDEAADLLTLNKADLKAEYQAMTDDQWLALVKECEAHFDLQDKDLETKLEATIEVGFRMIEAMRDGAAIWTKKAA